MKEKAIGDEKNIKDYLHLYLGCEVYNGAYPMWGFILEAVQITVGDKYAKLELIVEDEDGPYPDVGWVTIDKLKLILRPLSDMTEDENNESGKYQYPKLNEFKPFPISNHNPMYRPELFRYLLSKHFDLFGLIESNLAIDSTKFKSHA